MQLKQWIFTFFCRLGEAASIRIRPLEVRQLRSGRERLVRGCLALLVDHALPFFPFSPVGPFKKIKSLDLSINKKSKQFHVLPSRLSFLFPPSLPKSKF